METSKDQLTLDLDEPQLAHIDLLKPFKDVLKGLKKVTLNMMSIFL
jgi:hypothetical protein